MISSVAFCLSRSGFVALLGGLTVGAAVWLPQAREAGKGRGLLLALSIALALAAWFGYDRVVSRLSTFQSRETLQVGRTNMWSRILPAARDFPTFGSGLGTYQFVDLMYRKDAADQGIIVDHAHNDYLEILVEAGPIGLAAALTLLWSVSRAGLRAVRSGGGPAARGMAAGAVAGLASVAVHSLSDFNLHIPSNATLATVLIGYLCGAGRAGDGRTGEDDASRGGSPDRARGPISGPAVAAALLAALLASALLIEALAGARAEALRTLAASRITSFYDLDRYIQTVDDLEAAAGLVPHYARLQAEAAQANLLVYESKKAAITADVQAGRTGPPAAAIERIEHEDLVPALRHLLRSRDLCPLRAEAHLDIAAHLHEFESAEPRDFYLGRVKRLAPADPWLWYQCGIYEQADGRTEEAWASWRTSLGLAGTHLGEILERLGGSLGPSEILRRILPTRPDVLISAAERLYPAPGDPGRRPFLEKALASFSARSEALRAEELLGRASLHRDLGDWNGALADYRSALNLEPLRVDGRFQFAEFLYHRGQFADARRELLTIQGLDPQYAPARELMDAATRRLAEGN